MERILPTIAYYLAILALGLATAVLGPTLPGLATQTQSGASAISLVFAASSLGYMLGSLWAGQWYDRLPGHRLLAAALLLMAVMLTMTPLMSQLWSLAAVLLMIGMAEGAVDVGGNTLVIWLHGERVAPWMNGLHFCFGIGSVLAPLIVAQTVSMEGEVVLAYWVLAALVLPAAVWLLRLPCPAVPRLKETTRPKEDSRRLVFLIALFLGLYVGAEIGFGGWICSYAMTVNLDGSTNGAYLTAAFWGAFTFGRLVAVPLSTRLQPQPILLGDLVGCLAGVGIILGWPHSATALWLGTVATGLSMASIFPTTFSLAGRRVTITGKVTGWFIVGSAIGSMILPWLMGQLFEYAGPRAVILALLLDLLAAVAVLARLSMTPPENLSARGCRRNAGDACV